MHYIRTYAFIEFKESMTFPISNQIWMCECACVLPKIFCNLISAKSHAIRTYASIEFNDSTTFAISNRILGKTCDVRAAENWNVPACCQKYFTNKTLLKFMHYITMHPLSSTRVWPSPSVIKFWAKRVMCVRPKIGMCACACVLPKIFRNSISAKFYAIRTYASIEFNNSTTFAISNRILGAMSICLMIVIGDSHGRPRQSAMTLGVFYINLNDFW